MPTDTKRPTDTIIQQSRVSSVSSRNCCHNIIIDFYLKLSRCLGEELSTLLFLFIYFLQSKRSKLKGGGKKIGFPFLGAGTSFNCVLILLASVTDFSFLCFSV